MALYFTPLLCPLSTIRRFICPSLFQSFHSDHPFFFYSLILNTASTSSSSSSAQKKRLAVFICSWLLRVTSSHLGTTENLQHGIAACQLQAPAQLTHRGARALSRGHNWRAAKIASGNINAGCKGIYWRGGLFINQLTLVKLNISRRKRICGVTITDA